MRRAPEAHGLAAAGSSEDVHTGIATPETRLLGSAVGTVIATVGLTVGILRVLE